MSDHGHNRRQFLQRAALGVAGATLAGAVPGPVVAPAPAQGRQMRGYTAGRFFLTLDGVQAGWVHSMEGGHVTADVVTEPNAASVYPSKRLGPVRVEPFTMGIDFSMAGKVFSWLSGALQGTSRRVDGVVIAADFDNTARSQREFFEAAITEIGIPECDAGSKDPGYISVSLQPGSLRLSKGSGKVQWGAKGGAQQRVWLPSNFRLEIDGLDCTKVNKIDAFTIKQAVKPDELGAARDYAVEPGPLEIPNLKISLAEISAPSWVNWHEDFVIKGNNDETKEKNGRLVFLSPNRQTELFTIVFKQLGIFRLADDKPESAADTIKRMRAELYCERMELSYNAAVIG